MSLGKKTAQGVLWNLMSFGGSKVLTFVTTIILTRLLVPESFGQVALALVTITGLEAIGSLGIGAALIYQRDNIERAANVAFSISIAMGLVLWATTTLAAPFIGSYFGDPGVAALLRVLAFVFIIQSLGSIHNSLLSKELSFKRKLLPDLSRTLVKGGASITLALLGWGPWSLIWGQLLGEIATTVALWIVQPFRPRFVWDIQLGRVMLLYGLQIIAVETMAVLYTNVDYVIVGKVMGTADLAIYRQAFMVADLLIISLCWITARVLFPSYSKLSHDLGALRKGFLVTLRYIALVTIPLGFGLWAVAPLFVRTIFTEQWYGMIPLLQWLALRAAMDTLSFNAGSVFKAIGRPVIISKLIVVRLLILVPILLVAVRFGVIGVAVGQLCMAIIAGLLDFGMVKRVINVSFRDIFKSIQAALVAALGMGVAVWLFVSNSPNIWPGFALAGAVCIGIIMYAALLWVIERQFVLETSRTVLHVLRPERPTLARQER